MPRTISSRRRRRHILIVDDELTVLSALRSMLESVGFTVSCAVGAFEAITEIGAQRPDAILTDIYMPDGDGFELLNAITGFRENIPVICMSGRPPSDGYAPLQIADRLGACAIIGKPFQATDVVEILEKAIQDHVRQLA